MTRGLNSVGEKVVGGARALQRRAGKVAEDHEQVRSAQAALARGFHAAGNGARKVNDAIPGEVKAQVSEWGTSAANAVTRTGARISRAGLTPARVVRRHARAGHEITSLADVRDLDLEQVDKIRGRGLDWYYPGIAALSGAGAGLAVSGGELVIVASGGAAAAPGAGTIMSAIVLDAAAVLGLASRAVGQVSLHYGYDPEVPAEKLFVLSVVNAGTAMSLTAKTKALSEVSRLTQQLFRGAAWKVLDQSLITQLTKQLTARFGVRLTKQQLGKVVPAAGIILGASFNWTTLESIVDAADVAYRRRFLLAKYPQLADDEQPVVVEPDVPDDQDEEISVLDELVELGGPDLRSEEAESADTEPGDQAHDA